MRIGVIRWADLWRETKPNGEMLINASNANFNSFLETDSNLERLFPGIEKTQNDKNHNVHDDKQCKKHF